ncbi:beta strand repeat-containing protein, partial [Crocosphaera watsonii]
MAIIYVKSGSTGNGSSWNSAFGTLQSAIAAAQAGDQIWVAAGTYTPTTGLDRNTTFSLKNDVEIYGGFAGTETGLNQRNINNNVTILSGEIGSAGIADNSYHVVSAVGSIASPLNTSAILDGFTITGGNADGAGSLGNGGGVYVSAGSPTLNNITFRENNAINGGALYNENNSDPILTNVLFEYNTATRGAGIYNDFSSPEIVNGTFRLNAALNDGGAIYNTSSSNPDFVNAIFSRNSANTGEGGAIFNDFSNSTLTNSTLSNNSAVEGGGVYNLSSTTTLRNSIVWNNQDSSDTGTQILNDGGTINVSSTIVQNGEFNATDANPLFVNAKGDDLRLKSGSPGLNAGNQTLLPSDDQDLDGDGNTTEPIPLDLSGNSRVLGPNVELGAYEGAELSPAPTPAASRILYVRATALGDNNGTSWSNAFTDLQDALAASRSGDKIWVAGGTYKPTDGTDRNATFTLKNYVELYGGFAGTETTLSERNIAANATVLSGDIGAQNSIADNSYHVVTANSVTNTAILDGFAISNGNSNATSGANSAGGGMTIADGSPTLNNLIFENNNATAAGGLYLEQGAAPTITNTIFSNNTAANGGAIYNNTGAKPTLRDVIFANNTATTNGGAIYNGNSSPIVEDVTFSSNNAVRGAAVYSTGSNTNITDTVFQSNIASSQGGAIYSTGGTFNVTESEFNQNRATSSVGGAIFVNTTGATITNNDFLQNRAIGGGGIYVNANNVSVTNGSFTANVAEASDSGGGAIYQVRSNNFQVINTAFSRNSAVNVGGAIYQLHNSNIFRTDTTTITNSSFSNNSASSGSAIYSQGLDRSFDQDYRIVTNIRNSIIFGNSGTAVSRNSSSAAPYTVTDSIIQGGQFGGQNIDPLFVNAANDDLRLQNGSPAINIGDNTLLPADTQDLDGDDNTTETLSQDLARNPRVNEVLVDLGAFEFTTNNTPFLDDTTFFIAENSPVNTIAGTVTATDVDNDPLTYAINSGNIDLDGDGTDAFAINSSGQISIADSDDIDFEVNPTNSLIIAASDGTLSTTATVTINLTDETDESNGGGGGGGNDGNQAPQV